MNNKIIIVTAPSGSGKSTIVGQLMQTIPQLQFSISATTREPRGQEQNGEDYYFISVNDFQQKIEQKDFLEWEMVYANKYYGTLHNEVKRIQQNNNIPVLDIDVQGAIKVQENTQYEVCSIFIKVPSIKELENRLINRKTDSAEQIAERINKATTELQYQNQFKHIVINDNLNTATQQVIDIVRNFINY